jgi:hypothetical protein
MTTPKPIERVVAASLFAAPPVAGTYFVSQSGGSLLAVHMVRRVIGGSSPAYRLMGMRVKLGDLPDGVAALPWPRKPKVDHPTSAEELYGPPVEPVAIIPRAVQKVAERKRVVQLLIADKDRDRLVQTVRIANKSAGKTEWRDPDDLSAQRRTARVIAGYRAREELQILLDNDTISKGLAQAGRRLRREYELGEWGLRGSRDLAEEPTGFSSGGGPSEKRLEHLETWQQTAAALRPTMRDLLIAICVNDATIRECALRRGMNVSATVGAVTTALSFLREFYKEIDGASKDADRSA